MILIKFENLNDFIYYLNNCNLKDKMKATITDDIIKELKSYYKDLTVKQAVMLIKKIKENKHTFEIDDNYMTLVTLLLKKIK